MRLLRMKALIRAGTRGDLRLVTPRPAGTHWCSKPRRYRRYESPTARSKIGGRPPLTDGGYPPASARWGAGHEIRLAAASSNSRRRACHGWLQHFVQFGVLMAIYRPFTTMERCFWVDHGGRRADGGRLPSWTCRPPASGTGEWEPRAAKKSIQAIPRAVTTPANGAARNRIQWSGGGSTKRYRRLHRFGADRSVDRSHRD